MTLTFADYVRKISSSLLYDYLLDSSSNSVISEEVYQSIVSQFMTIEGVSQRAEGLSDDLRDLVYEIYLSGSVGVVVDEETSQKLLASFLVYEAIDADDKNKLYGFSDLASIVSEFIASFCSEQKLEADNTIFWPHHDLVIILDHIQANHMQLKQDHDIMKSSVDLVFSTTTLSQLVLSLSQKRLFVTVLLRSLEDIGFIYSRHRAYGLTDAGKAFAQGTMVDFEKVASHILSCKSLGNTAFVMKIVSEDNGCELPEVTETSAALEAVTLGYLQWLRKIVVQESIVALRIATKPMGTQEIGHLMPDFSLIIPPEITPSALFSILNVADIERVDMIFYAKIKQEKVLESLARGIVPQNIEKLLRKWNAPESICHTVLEWCDSFEQLYFDQGSFLAVRPDQTATMAAIDEVHELLEPITNYQVFKVREGKQELLKARLLERGFDIRKPQGVFDTVQEESTPFQVAVLTPNFAPKLTGEAEQVVSKAGRYGGAPRPVRYEEIQKLVRYALLMDEQLIVFLKEHELPIVFTPTDIRTGNNGYIEGKDEQGEDIHISIDSIERMGAISQ